MHPPEVGSESSLTKIFATRVNWARDPATLAFTVAVADTRHATCIGRAGDVGGNNTRETCHEFGLCCVCFEANPTKQAGEGINRMLKPLVVGGGDEAIVCIEEGQAFPHTKTETGHSNLVVGDNQGQPVTYHVVNANVEHVWSEDPSLGTSTCGREHLPMKTTLTGDYPLAVPEIPDNAEESLTHAVIAQGVESSTAVQRIVGFLEIKKHLEEGLLADAGEFLLEFRLDSGRAGVLRRGSGLPSSLSYQ
jgi:hypothetical protein